ncbi:MAG: O-antigen ligase family protein [Candidatus Peregrinibacteria bacterium]
MIFKGILVTVLLTVFGQLLRLPVGGGAGVLLLDAWIPLLVCAWGFQKFWRWGQRKSFSFPKEIVLKPFFWGAIGFFGIALGSLLWNAQYFDFFTLLESGFYLFRYSFLVLFAVVVMDEMNTPARIQIFLKTLVFSAGGLVLLGFLQLVFFPNFTVMQAQGWDPHINRLLSTWFDPNFFGGFLAFFLSLFFGVLLFSPLTKGVPHIPDFLKNKRDTFLGALAVIFFLALLLTLSRSGFLSFLVVGFLFGIFFFRKLLAIGFLAILVLLPLFPHSFTRISEGVSSVFSVAQQEESLFLPDATARLRVENMQEGIVMSQKNPWIGVGFNTLRFFRNQELHSSGGFDASLLTVLTTTGILGLGFFLFFWGGMAWEGMKTFKNTQNTALHRGISLGFSIGSMGILVHSFFVNTLFFPLFLVFFFGIFGLLHATGWRKDHIL